MVSRDRGWMVLALFFCSGATALVYEVVWSKFLSQMFGSTVYAQTAVLAAFMGGLALGNRLFGRWADRLHRPLRAYGYLEMFIGLYAFFFPTLDRLADWIFVAVGTGLAERAGWLLALKTVLSAGLLLGPTILMGGTLPLMAAWLQKSVADPGRRSARFYSVNSLGAVVGAGFAGFWLVQHLGMVSSLQMTALINVIVGAVAMLLGRSPLSDASPSAGPAPHGLEVSSPETLRWAGLIVALTGGVSMGLEVLSSRSLVLLFGSSLQSFSVVLMAFILGIGLGSAWIASPRRDGKSGERITVALLCLAAAWVTLLVFNIERWVDVYRIARIGLQRNPTGFLYHQLLTSGMSLVVLGLPAACIGAVLPLMIRAVSVEGAPLGAKVGALLTWNTLGAVVGTLVTGFVLMPVVGLRNAFGVLALVLGAAALLVAWRRGWRLGMAGAAACCVFAAALFVFGGESWRQVMNAGVFRARETEFNPNTMPLRKKHIQILFYEDAPDATVSVEKGDGTGAPPDLGLRINGKPDASSRVDLGTQLLVAHLPMLARPGAKDVFVLGLGSGISGGALLAYPVDQIVIAENCEPVVRAAGLFNEWNHRVLEDPRVRVWNEDARTVLKLRPQLYDVIITQPSNPWTVGVGSVFSLEYYQLAASRLKPGGIVAQWFHVYEMHDGIVGLVLRTFSSVFPYLEIWDTGTGDIVMLGGLQPWRSSPEVFGESFGIERVRSDMALIGIANPAVLLARQLASQRTGFAIAGDGPIQSDLFPLLEYAAPRAFFIGASSTILNHFDERTRQQLLAPPAKRASLRAVPIQDLHSLSSNLGTSNEELFRCLGGSSKGVPCLFVTNSPMSAPPTLPLDFTNAPSLEQAITLLNGTEEQQREGIRLVESVVRGEPSSTRWPAADWAALAAAAAFNLGDLQQAGQLANLALQLEPANLQAGYVARVTEREWKHRQAGGAPP